MSKHTPGPWKFHQESETIEAESGVVVYETNTNYADCCLISAAPDLLDALQDALCALEVCGRDYDYVMGKARDAIAKARGN